MKYRTKSWLLAIVACATLPGLACAQDRTPRLDPGIGVDSALVLLRSLNPADHSTAAVVLMGLIRSYDGVDDRARLEAVRKGLVEVVVSAPDPGARATALNIAQSTLPGRVLLSVEETETLVRLVDDAGVRGEAVGMLGVHQDTAAALNALGRLATSDIVSNAQMAERAVLTMAEMGEKGRVALRAMYASGTVAPAARATLARLAVSDFRIRN